FNAITFTEDSIVTAGWDKGLYRWQITGGSWNGVHNRLFHPLLLVHVQLEPPKPLRPDDAKGILSVADSQGPFAVSAGPVEVQVKPAITILGTSVDQEYLRLCG
ncbi:hypothetical protein, partial [Streptomyces sp. NPDC052015]|uniref:hypothetical protein n=1 Tax=Streptomyces sp. NPDC052015 TaxID=3154755 RepID=UPI0034176FAC